MYVKSTATLFYTLGSELVQRFTLLFVLANASIAAHVRLRSRRLRELQYEDPTFWKGCLCLLAIFIVTMISDCFLVYEDDKYEVLID